MEDAELEDIFAGLGAITVKRLFGGRGVYHRGLIVGAVMDGEVMLKVDAESAPQFLAAGATQWVYRRPSGKAAPMPYWTIPIDDRDDPERLATWVRRAFAAAVRAASQ